MRRTRRSISLRSCATALALSCSAVTFGADVTATWLEAVNGRWDGPQFWSTAPDVPDNTAGTTYDVLFDAPDAGYFVSVYEDATVNNVIMNSPYVTLVLQENTLHVIDTIQVNDGGLQLHGGGIKGARIEVGEEGSFTVRQNQMGILDGVTLRGTLYTNSNTTLTLRNGLTLDDGELIVGGITPAGTYTDIRAEGEQSIDGTGLITFVRNGGGTIIVPHGILTLGPDISFRTSVQAPGSFRIGGAGQDAAVVNDGTLRAGTESIGIGVYEGGVFTNNNLIWAQNGGTISLNGLYGPIVNHGVIRTAPGGTIHLANDWTNHGEININGGTLELGGTVDLDRLQGVSVFNNGLVDVRGELDLTGQVLELDDHLSNLKIGSGGKLIGATVQSSSGHALKASSGELDSVVLEADLEVTYGFGVSNGLELRDVDLFMVAPGSSESYIGFDGEQTVSGEGTIWLNEELPNRITANLDSELVTLGPGIRIEVGGADATIGQNAGRYGGPTNFDYQGTTKITADGDFTLSGNWTHSGTIQADQATVTLEGEWTNSGTIIATGSTVNLAGRFTWQSAGELDVSGGQTNFVGTLANTGQAFNFNIHASEWQIDGGTIEGGRLRSGDGQPVIVGQGDVLTLEAVQLDTPLELVDGGDLTIKDRLNMIEGSVLRLSGGPNFFRLQGAVSIIGSGEIVAAGEYTSSLSIQDIDGRLTLGQNILLRNSEQASFYLGGARASQRVVNFGTISSEVAERTVGLNGTWENRGTLRVLDGTLALSGYFTTAGMGTIDRQGGAIEIHGEMDNSGDVFEINSTMGSIGLRGGTIRGGTIRTTQGHTLELLDTNLSLAIFDGVTADMDFAFSATELRVRNGLTIGDGHTWTLDNLGTIHFWNTQSLSGDADIFLVDRTSKLTIETGHTLTIEPGIRVIKSSPFNSQIGDSSVYQSGAWINRGTIEIDHPDGSLSFLGDWSNQGVVRVADGILHLSGTYTPADMGIIERTGGTIKISGTFQNQGLDTTFNPAIGQLLFSRTRVMGGRLATSDGFGMVFDEVELHDVTLASDGDALFGEESKVFGDLTLEDTTVRLGDPEMSPWPDEGSISFMDGSQLIGTGEIVFNTDVSSGNHIFGTGLVIDEGIVIRNGNSDGTGRGSIGRFDESWTNRGLILVEAPDGAISLSGQWTNYGTIRHEAGDLFLNGDYSAAGLGNFEQTGGRIILGGSFDNTGNTITLGQSASTWALGSVTLSGGTIISIGEVPLVTYNTSSITSTTILDDVTLDADLIVNDRTHVEFIGGLNLPVGRTISLQGNENTTRKTGITITGGQSITGGGEIVFDGTQLDQSIATGDPTLTIGPDITIRTGTGQGTIGTRTFSQQRDVVNHGLISAQTPGNILTVRGRSLINYGTLEAVNGGILNMELPWENHGVIRLDGGVLEPPHLITTAQVMETERSSGTVRLTRTLDNANATLRLDNPNVTYELSSGGRINGGRIEEGGGGPLIVRPDFGGRMYGVEIDASIQIQSDAILEIRDDTQLLSGARIEFSPLTINESADLRLEAGLLEQAQGEIVFGGLGTGSVEQFDGPFTVGPELTIRTTTGRGIVGWITRGPTITAAHIIAQGDGRSITLTGNDQNINTGHIEALDGATVNFQVRWRHDGLLTIDAGVVGILDNRFDRSRTIDPGQLEISALGVVKGVGQIVIADRGEFVNAGLIAPGLPIGDLYFNGRFTQNTEGTLEITLAGKDPGVSYDRLIVSRSIDLAGRLAIELADDFVPATGDRFDILPFTGTRDGMFDSVVADVFAPTGFWHLIEEPNVIAVQYLVLGDFDGNGTFDAFDIDEFELALADRQAYTTTHPDLDPDLLGDFDGDGRFDAFDIDNFEAALANQSGTVPEPGTLVLLTGSLLALRIRPDCRRSAAG